MKEQRVALSNGSSILVASVFCRSWVPLGGAVSRFDPTRHKTLGKSAFELGPRMADAIKYVSYQGEEQLPLIMGLIDHELSEPYSIFTYRYFITLWPQLCFMAFHDDNCVGTIVCKMGQHRNTFRGYIAMLVVIKPYRGRGIATELVTRSIQVMRDSGCEEVILEAEVTNKGALALYGNLGFIRAKRLYKYYLNGVDAFRLKLLFPRPNDLNYSLPSYDENSDIGCRKREPHHHHSDNAEDDHSGCSGHGSNHHLSFPPSDSQSQHGHCEHSCAHHDRLQN